MYVQNIYKFVGGGWLAGRPGRPAQARGRAVHIKYNKLAIVMAFLNSYGIPNLLVR